MAWRKTVQRCVSMKQVVWVDGGKQHNGFMIFWGLSCVVDGLNRGRTYRSLEIPKLNESFSVTNMRVPWKRIPCL